MDSATQQRLIDILDYWHKIEFFIPFDLDQLIDGQDDWKLRWLAADHLTSWPGTMAQQFDLPDEREISGFRLYLGLFERSEIAAVCQRALPPMAAVADDVDEDAERGQAEGRTCFARIDLNAYGEPLFDPISVSTVPWALGRTQAHGLDSLGSQAFAAAKCDLRDRLKQFHHERPRALPHADGGAPPAPLTGAEIVALSALLCEWAGFTPASAQPVLLEIRTRQASPKKDGPDKSGALPHGSAPTPKDDDLDDDEPAIDILNSFFISDIEHAIEAVRAGQAPLLAAYLLPLAQDQRIDLYTDAGRQALIEQLHPARSNRGHWLSKSTHGMSLMQQFAINAARSRLHDGGIFAVNGPPGTGKTTLLREIFADNIVRRAAVLAELGSAAEAFSGPVTVHFADGKKTTVRALKPALTGFEMVVASSNNAAVENISRDLPKLAALDEGWQDVGYLRSVAYRIAAEDDDGHFHPSPELAPWGLISCALGNSSNRRRFVSKFYHQNWNRKVPADPRCQNIAQWMATYDGPSFVDAAQAFRDLAAQVEQRTAALADYADCWQQSLALDDAALLQQEQDAQARAEQCDLAHRAAAADLQEMGVRQAELREDERLLDRERPAWWVRWFRPVMARRHREARQANAGAQRALLRELVAARQAEAAALSACRQQQAAVVAARAALEACRQQRRAVAQKMHDYQQRFSCALPASPAALEQDDFQIAGLWHEAALADLRSRLFAAALALHEAWLAEVGPSGGPGFGGNLFAISQLLSNNRPDLDAHVPLIWQSLFMVVPVVSTTFASLARQFQAMDAGSLGWLFIDEAGQAVPQAAVGALWRARRAVVVGDPRQIEPVFTVPLALIRTLSAQTSSTASEAYAPDKVSVQVLADQANLYGTQASQPDGVPLWIGSPLRVHRRCADPMFSLANQIAYDGKMVIEPRRRVPAPLAVPMGASAWIDIGGEAAYKQVVHAQVAFVGQLLLALYRQQGKLPEVYVISPFKAVRDALRKCIAELEWPGKPPTRSAVKAWCKASVGTVHTFQGKEQAAVLMVLGVGTGNTGSATWAAAKPNLLNVALTRAQQHFYVVGAGEIWGSMAYFGAAYAALPKRSPAQFLDEIGNAYVGPDPAAPEHGTAG